MGKKKKFMKKKLTKKKRDKIYLLDPSDFLKKLEIVNSVEISKMQDSSKAVVLYMTKSDVPLVMPLCNRIGEIILECEVAVHDPSAAQHVSRRCRLPVRLNDDPHYWGPHQPQGVRQPGQCRLLEPVLWPGRCNDYQQTRRV